MNKRRRFKAKARRRARAVYARFVADLWADKFAVVRVVGVDWATGKDWTVTR